MLVPGIDDFSVIYVFTMLIFAYAFVGALVYFLEIKPAIKKHTLDEQREDKKKKIRDKYPHFQKRFY